MKSVFKLLLCFCLFAVLPFAVSAQSFTGQTVDLGDSISIIVPDDWQATENENGFFTLEGNGITNRPLTLKVMTPRYIRALGINFNEDRNIGDVLIALTTLFDGVEPDRNELQKGLYDERAASSFRLTDDQTTDTLNVALTLNDGSFGYLTVTVGNGQLVALDSQIDEIIASFDTTRTGAVTGAACTVSVDAADAAQLRVGPGTNRGAISFLPADTDVTATGRIELDDGSIWYQLNLDEAAPGGTAAAELWVFEEDVTLSGDCENVGETSAPPVIRAAPQPADSTTGGSETPGASSTPAAGLLEPTDGEYAMTLAPVINASCTGGENVPLSTAQVYEGEINYLYYIVVVDANSFYYGEDLYRRYPGSNSFDGIFTYEGGEQSPARIDVLSPSMVHGEINDLIPYDGYSCSATLLFNATLN